jgi:heat shock protein HslJ
MKSIYRIFLLISVAGVLFYGAACSLLPTIGGDPLDGTSWILMAYRKSKPLEGTTITAVFEDGQIHGSAGCNSYSAAYEVNGDKITISGPMAMTMMACMEPEGAMDQEQMYAGFLQDATSYQLSDEQLVIQFTAHETLTFVPPMEH